MPLELFSPYLVATTAVSVSGTTARGALNMPPSTPAGNVSVRIFNSVSVTVFVKFGDVTVTAATTDMPIPAGGVETFQISSQVTHVAGITAGTSGTLYVTPGLGA